MADGPIDVKGCPVGPPKFRAWSDSIAAAISSLQNKLTVSSWYGKGSSGGTAGEAGGEDSAGGGDLTFEVITGAHNGVPATRRVAVDPDEDGWQNI